MEELFREAAEKYHVDTEQAAAWDDVYAALHGDEQPGPVPPGNGRNKRWLNLLWLLLIPLGWFAHNLWDDTRDGKTANKQATVQNNNTAAATNNNNEANRASDNKVTAGGSDNGVASGSNDATSTAGINSKPANSSAQTATTAAKANDNVAGTSPTGMRKDGFSTKGRSQVKTFGGNIGTTAGNDDNSKDNGTIAKKTPAEPVPHAATAVTNTVPGNNGNAVTPPQAAPQSGNRAYAAVPGNNTAAVTPPAAPNSTVANSQAGYNNNKPGKSSKDKKPAKASEHYVYAGMLASPDISFIHGQKTSPVGVNAGIIAGYAFNKHLSIETGVLFTKKNYYTKGEYFDKNRIAWFSQRPDVKVIDVQGNCKMIEVPINIRYTFMNKGRNRLYALTGLSTYFMGKEYYDYNLDAWGSQYPKEVSYNNHINNWFSILNVGAGYERQLGNKTSLRVEPFIKLPVSGVGSGNINLTSTGVYIGVTRRIP